MQTRSADVILRSIQRWALWSCASHGIADGLHMRRDSRESKIGIERNFRTLRDQICIIRLSSGQKNQFEITCPLLTQHVEKRNITQSTNESVVQVLIVWRTSYPSLEFHQWSWLPRSWSSALIWRSFISSERRTSMWSSNPKTQNLIHLFCDNTILTFVLYYSIRHDYLPWYFRQWFLNSR